MLAMSEFAIESILREGLNDIRNDNTDIRLEDALGRLTFSDLSAKFGTAEVEKIKDFILRGDINIVHSLSQLREATFPSFSIHLMSDSEADGQAGLGDMASYTGLGQGDEEEGAISIEPAIIVPIFTATSYNSTTGRVSVPDSVDLQNVYKGRLYFDGDGITHTVNYPISNIRGDKYFTLESDIDTINLVDSQIKSCVDKRVFEVRYSPTNENIMIGVHSENALLTKYLYYILRYILYRKRDKFQEYQMQLSKYNGSDFSLQQTLMPEHVYSRWITAQFITYNTWRNDELIVFDAVNPSMGGVSPLARIIFSFDPISYDSTTGVVTVPNSVDLSLVLRKDVFFDAAGYDFTILGDISNVNGSKQFRIKAGQTVDLTAGAAIKRPYKVRVEGGSEREDEQDYTWESKE